MPIELTTPNRGYELPGYDPPTAPNLLSFDLPRLFNALMAIDEDIAAQVTAIAAKAGLASPVFTGTPTAPTPSVSDDTSKIATTAFVKAAIAALVDSSPGTLDTLNELAAALGDDPNFASTITTLIGGKTAKNANLSDLTNIPAAVTNLGFSAYMAGLKATADVAALRAALGLAYNDSTAQAAFRAAIGLAYNDDAARATFRSSIHAPLRGHIFGLTLANDTTDAANDVVFGAGEAASAETNPALMVLASSLIKRSDAAWAVGSGNGGLDDGTIADGTIHHYLISRSDTGVVDGLQSLSPERSGTVTISNASPAVVTWADHGLQVGSRVVFTTTVGLPTGLTAGTVYYVISAGFAVGSFRVAATQGGSAINTSSAGSGTHTATSAPKMPTNYDHRRRIGSLLRLSSTIVPFLQVDNRFQLITPVRDVNISAPGTSAVLRALSVPTGVKVEWEGSAQIRNHSGSANGRSWFLDPDVTDFSAATATDYGYGASSNDVNIHLQLKVFTDRSGQIRTRAGASSASTGLSIFTMGWKDTLGRFA